MEVPLATEDSSSNLAINFPEEGKAAVGESKCGRIALKNKIIDSNTWTGRQKISQLAVSAVGIRRLL